MLKICYQIQIKNIPNIAFSLMGGATFLNENLQLLYTRQVISHLLYFNEETHNRDKVNKTGDD